MDWHRSGMAYSIVWSLNDGIFLIEESFLPRDLEDVFKKYAILLGDLKIFPIPEPEPVFQVLGGHQPKFIVHNNCQSPRICVVGKSMKT